MRLWNFFLLASFFLALGARADLHLQPWQPLFKSVEITTGRADPGGPRLQAVTAVRIHLQTEHPIFSELLHHKVR